MLQDPIHVLSVVSNTVSAQDMCLKGQTVLVTEKKTKCVGSIWQNRCSDFTNFLCECALWSHIGIVELCDYARA